MKAIFFPNFARFAPFAGEQQLSNGWNGFSEHNWAGVCFFAPFAAFAGRQQMSKSPEEISIFHHFLCFFSVFAAFAGVAPFAGQQQLSKSVAEADFQGFAQIARFAGEQQLSNYQNGFSDHIWAGVYFFAPFAAFAGHQQMSKSARVFFLFFSGRHGMLFCKKNKEK